MSGSSLPTIVNIASVGKGITITPMHSNREPFSMTRRFNMSGSPHLKYDLLEVLVNKLSQKEAELFIKIKDSTNYKTNMSTVDFGEMSLSQRNYLSTLIGSLKEVDLVKRCKGQHVNLEDQIITFPPNTFIVNPAYIVPPDAYYPAIYHMWKMLE